MRDLRYLTDLTIHDVKPIRDELTTERRHSLRYSTDHHLLELQRLQFEKTEPGILNPSSHTIDPNPHTLNPQHSTLIPNPQAFNPKL